MEAAARKDGVPLDELLRKLMDEHLDKKESFSAIKEYVLKKNAELYRRLAQ